jgi:hypothetical protein
MVKLNRSGRWLPAFHWLIVTTLLWVSACSRITAAPPVASRAQLRQDCFRLLSLGRTEAALVTVEPTKAEVIFELSVAHAQAADVIGARALAETIPVPAVKVRALCAIATVKVELGDLADAKAMAESFVDQMIGEQVLFAVAKAQAKAGDTVGASVTAKGLVSPAGRAMEKILIAELNAKAGDGAGYRRLIQEARDLVKSLPPNQESAPQAWELIKTQIRVGDNSGAIATANEWKDRHVVQGNIFVEVMGAQADAGDIVAAKATSELGGFTDFAASRAWARVADAQGRAGKFTEAKEFLGRVSRRELRSVAEASLCAQTGNLDDGKKILATLLVESPTDDYHHLLYRRAVAPLVVLQAKTGGFPSAEKWVESLGDPPAKAFSYAALAGLRYTANSPEYKSLLTQSRITGASSSPVPLTTAAARPSTPLTPNAVTASPAAKLPAAPSSTSLVTSSLPSGGAVKGKFHLYIDDYIRLYVNGVEVFASNVLMTGESKEIELKANDRIVARVRNGWGGRGLILIFVASDQKRMISFPHTAFKSLLNPEAPDFTPLEFQQGKMSKEDKGYRGKPLPYKNQSELVWGESDVCVLGSIIRTEMFQPVPR